MSASVEILPPVDVAAVPSLTSRVHADTQREQFLVGDLLRHLKTRRPRHALTVAGVTLVDLYPGPQWNFVMGHALLTEGCAVVSFGRYFNTAFEEGCGRKQEGGRCGREQVEGGRGRKQEGGGRGREQVGGGHGSVGEELERKQLQHLWILMRVCVVCSAYMVCSIYFLSLPPLSPVHNNYDATRRSTRC